MPISTSTANTLSEPERTRKKVNLEIKEVKRVEGEGGSVEWDGSQE